ICEVILSFFINREIEFLFMENEEDENMKITFLGTGLPIPNTNRAGQGILISHEGVNVLFDVGLGVNRRIMEANIKHNDINHLVLTHLHWDHFGDYDALVQTGFVTDRQEPLQVFGPHGTKEVTDLLFNK